MRRLLPPARSVAQETCFGLQCNDLVTSEINPTIDAIGHRRGKNRPCVQGHLTNGGIDERMDSTLPPVLRPKIVPRS